MSCADPAAGADGGASSAIGRAIAFLDAQLARTNGSRTARFVHIALTSLAVVFLTVRLAHLGFAAVAAALPRNPLYYALFAVSYFVLPISEAVIYRRLLPARLGFRDYLRKRVFNEMVLDYAGEGYLFNRFRERLPDQVWPIAKAVKDVNLLSGMVSNSTTILLLVIMAATGQLGLLAGPGERYPVALIIGAALVTLVLIGLAVFHRRLIALPLREACVVAGLHALRLGLGLALQVAQWRTILPDVSLARWGLFLTVWMLGTRIPFVPNRDLLLAGVGVTLSHLVDAPTATVAGMFVTGAVLPLLGHIVVLAVTSFSAPVRPRA